MSEALPEAIVRSAPRFVAIGASAGGLEALLAVLRRVPRDGRLCIAIVLHLPQEHDSSLPELFSSRLACRAAEAQAHAPARPGMIYIAPPGYHLLVEPDETFGLSCEPPVHFSRPSIDVLFESCADSLGAAAAGIVLTGANEDGADGLARIGDAGGVTIVQDPGEAAHDPMPLAAIERAAPDAVLPLSRIAEVLEYWSGPNHGK